MDHEWNLLKREEASWAAPLRQYEWDPLDARHRAARLTVFPAMFQACFHKILFCTHIPSFWNGNVYPIHWYHITCFIFLQKFMAKCLP